MVDKIDRLTPDLFLDGPTEFLSKSLASEIIKEYAFASIFGESVDSYDREDYSMRALPAVRIYSPSYTKETESHYITGDIKVDVIFPPEIRRDQTEEFQGRVSAALLQQFRRPAFFETMKGLVPGLNELGKVFSVDKTLGFQNTSMNDECPVTQITLNFRIDLKVWDEYLETQGRTKDEPFKVVLDDLIRIASVIQGIKKEADLETKDIEIESAQTVEE